MARATVPAVPSTLVEPRHRLDGRDVVPDPAVAFSEYVDALIPNPGHGLFVVLMREQGGHAFFRRTTGRWLEERQTVRGEVRRTLDEYIRPLDGENLRWSPALWVSPYLAASATRFPYRLVWAGVTLRRGPDSPHGSSPDLEHERDARQRL